MKITEIKSFPVRVKINENFRLEDSIDPNMIVQLNNYSLDSDYDGKCYKVDFTLLSSDFEHNNTVAVRDWLDFKTHEYNQNYFEANEKYLKKSDGHYHDTLYVMEDEDVFDLVEENFSIEMIKTNAIIAELKRISENLKLTILDEKEDSSEWLKGYNQSTKDAINCFEFRIKELSKKI